MRYFWGKSDIIADNRNPNNPVVVFRLPLVTTLRLMSIDPRAPWSFEFHNRCFTIDDVDCSAGLLDLHNLRGPYSFRYHKEKSLRM